MVNNHQKKEKKRGKVEVFIGREGIAFIVQNEFVSFQLFISGRSKLFTFGLINPANGP